VVHEVLENFEHLRIDFVGLDKSKWRTAVIQGCFDKAKEFCRVVDRVG
jgi:hypothetical protein